MKYSFILAALLMFSLPLAFNAGARPHGSSISGFPSLCKGTTKQYTDSIPLGIWSTNNPSIATVDSITGYVTGILAGDFVITYSIGGGYAVYFAKVDSTYGGMIYGDSTLCENAYTLFSDTYPGGSWVSSNPYYAYPYPDGSVLGVGVGIADISYTVINSCGTYVTTKTVTVLPSPAPIDMPNIMCRGSIFPVFDRTLGGVWSTVTGNVNISSALNILATCAGLDTVIYTVPNGCTARLWVQIDAPPSPIIADSIICLGSSVAYSDSVTGGVWASSDSNIALFVGSLIYGQTIGNSTISYSDRNSCGSLVVTLQVTVNIVPSVIVAPPIICTGALVTATDSILGGTWYSSLGKFNIDSFGTINAISIGFDSITYRLPSGCSISFPVEIRQHPTPISGDTLLCLGGSTTFYNAISDGVWSATNDSTIDTSTVSNNFIVNSAMPGFVILSYTNYCGSDSIGLTVLTSPSAGSIHGVDVLCQGASITLADSVASGIWTSRFDSVATIAAGVVTGISGGVDLLIYKVTNMCGSDSTGFFVMVNPLPTAGIISGPDSICVGSTTVFFDTTYLNTSSTVWGLTNSMASLTTAGNIYGNITGFDTVVFKVYNSCGVDSTQKTIFIRPLPVVNDISGIDTICAGSSVTLSDITTGGVWSNSTSGADIVADGVVTGLSGGIDTIFYSVSNICGTVTVSLPITVNPQPFGGVISCADSICIGEQVLLVESNPTGVWSLINTYATISNDTLSGASTGLDTVVYTVVNNCGSTFVQKTIWVKPPPDAGLITGPDSLCIGNTITLSDLVIGGIWASNTANASVAGGIVTGDLAGLDTITYTVNNCGVAFASKPIKILKIPFVSPIVGLDSVCLGSSISLTDSTYGGIWSSLNSFASVTGGVVTGLALGYDSIKYAVSNMCGTWFVTRGVTVWGVPAPNITAPTAICVGIPTTLSGAPLGGVWSSINSTAAISGNILTGNNSGTDTVKYTATNSCGSATVSQSIDIEAIPTPLISGSSLFCIGKSTTLSGAPAGGVWAVTDSNVILAPDFSGELVTGNNNGMDTVLYTVSNSCGAYSDTLSILVHTKHECDSISGVQETEMPQVAAIAIAPNPTTGDFIVNGNLGNGVEEAIIEVSNILGQEMFKISVFVNNGKLTLPVTIGSLPNGAYLVAIITGENRYVVRVVKR